MTSEQRGNLILGILLIVLAGYVGRDQACQIVIALLCVSGTLHCCTRELPIDRDWHLPVWVDLLLGAALVVVLLRHGAYEAAVCATAVTIADCTFR